MKELKLLKVYGNNFPSKQFLNIDPPPLPLLYTVYLNINNNTKQNQMGNKKYVRYDKVSMNDSFKNIADTRHIYLNHLFFQTRKYGLSNISNKNKQYLFKK